MKMMKWLFLILLSFPVFGQNNTLTGRVISKSNEPVPFAKVWVSNTSHGTVANGKGEYRLTLKSSGQTKISVSSAEFKNLDTTIVITQNTSLNFYLSPVILEIGEVQVEAKNKKTRGKELMRKVIPKRDSLLELSSEYSCNTYCFSSLDKKEFIPVDSILTEDFDLEKALMLKKMTLNEWTARTYYKAKSKYKKCNHWIQRLH